MRISQLAARSGVPATTLRFYESAGLLPADRTPAGHRVYGEDAVDRLAFIGAAKHLGLPLDEVAALLAVRESGTCAEVKADLRPRVAARIAEATARTAELAAFTGALRRSLDHLDALPDRPGRCDPACGFLAPPASPPPPPVSPTPGAERWRSAPVACSLDGVGFGERVARWRELTDGAEPRYEGASVRLALPAERAGAVAESAAAEQRCCPFLDFVLRLDGPRLHLRVQAPPEGTALLAELFGPPV
ncbi:MerR family transcriptional regulator [Streptomyces phytohabitans]|uniref:MerR family transcriptional regulator n=1 Tax=Streptomyces phytohabitans TaxID=1150371 RepID=UPI00345BA7C6